MSRQFWSETIAWATASGTAVANSTTETILFPDLTIPANYVADGRTFRGYAKGQYSTTGTPTLLFSLRWGGVAGVLLCKSAAITGASAVTAALWEVEYEFTVRTNGATGALMANGRAVVHSGTAPTVGSATGAPGISPMTNGGIVTPATATVDLTADKLLSLTITWGTASASNTITGLQYTLDAVN